MTSDTERPLTPRASSESRTASSLDGTMIASSFFMAILLAARCTLGIGGTARGAPRPRSGRGAGRLAVALAELEVQLEDVHHRDTEQPAARRERLLLDQRLDVAAHLPRIALRVLCPRVGDAIELALHVVERDVRVEPGARRYQEIGRHVV